MLSVILLFFTIITNIGPYDLSLFGQILQDVSKYISTYYQDSFKQSEM